MCVICEETCAIQTMVIPLLLYGKIFSNRDKQVPIISRRWIILELLGVWVDQQLQQVACIKQIYLKSSSILKGDLVHLRLPYVTCLFKDEAISMYTNIPTRDDPRLIYKDLFCPTHWYPNTPIKSLIQAVIIVVMKNVFIFGYTHCHQV